MKQQALRLNPQTSGETISLKGNWHLRLDTPYLGEMERWWLKDLSGEYGILLPSTLEEAGIGYPPTPARGRPARKHEYEGCAWYQRKVEIPDNWEGKHITLFFERISRMSRVWIDRDLVGDCDSISTPHVYDVSAFLTPGEHTLTVMVDNTYAWIYGTGTFIGKWSSGICDDLQTNWNGILGEMLLIAEDPVTIESCIITPHTLDHEATFDLKLSNSGDDLDFTVQYEIWQDGSKLTYGTVAVEAFSGEKPVSFQVGMPEETVLWDHETPAMCEAVLRVLHKETICACGAVEFGYREFKAVGTNFVMNGNNVFIRGSVEYTAFPKTGHVPMDEGEWEEIFALSKQYGINHYRFHSYCPPEAGFRAADRLGMTLHVELPIWAEKPGYGEQIELVEFMKREGERILKTYANHPSFAMLCLGNEYKSNFDVLDSVIAYYKSFCNDKLYTFTSNYVSDSPTPGSDFFVSDHTAAERMRINCWTKDGRFQAYMDGTDYDYSASVAVCPVPIVAHELGQWSSFPDYSYLDNYGANSIFDPENERILAKRLEAAGMMWQNKDFHYATGRWSWLLYKEEMETCMRTPGYGGYVLLSLADSPGFGEAFTGAVDPWWKSKSFIKPEEIKRFCNTVVPLLRFPKYVYKNNEYFLAKAVVANYGKQDITGKKLLWKAELNGEVWQEGAFAPDRIQKGGPVDIGELCLNLDGIEKASELKITLTVAETEFENDWSIWVYPAAADIDFGDICVTRAWAEAEKALKEGRDVLLVADDAEFDMQATRFVSMFWSFWWFWRWEDPQPGNMSILCDPRHPALADFPTSPYTNWQWWEILEQSRAFRITGVPEGYAPVVQVIDDYHRNQRLGTVVEAKVEKGRLIACSNDLLSDLNNCPAKKQLLSSIVRYMKGDSFDPHIGYGAEELKRVLGYIGK